MTVGSTGIRGSRVENFISIGWTVRERIKDIHTDRQSLLYIYIDKATGADGIVAEFIKAGGHALHLKLYELIINIWRTEELPHDWKESLLIHIFKKGDKFQFENYRGISLLSTSYNILSAVLLNRLKPYLEYTLGDYQAGFRQNRSTIDQIFILRQIAEKSWKYKKDLHKSFVDFKKAYDSVHRNSLWNAVQEFGIPRKLINMTRRCMEDTYNSIGTFPS